MEPFRLRRWKIPSADNRTLYTCARPGRSKCSKCKVPDKLVHDWARGLPLAPNLALISLLGTKPDGMSEFAFYSAFTDAASFERWLADNTARPIEVIAHPTRDRQKVPADTLAAVAADLSKLLAEGRTVLLMDSGGQERTGQVCRFIGAVEDFGSLRPQ